MARFYRRTADGKRVPISRDEVTQMMLDRSRATTSITNGTVSLTVVSSSPPQADEVAVERQFQIVQ